MAKLKSNNSYEILNHRIFWLAFATAAHTDDLRYSTKSESLK
jgi:hypothetical protein